MQRTSRWRSDGGVVLISADAIFIVLTLGGLEGILWWFNHREAKEQTELLAELVVALAGCEITEKEADTEEEEMQSVAPN